VIGSSIFARPTPAVRRLCRDWRRDAIAIEGGLELGKLPLRRQSRPFSFFQFVTAKE
jgi:hypothetical protein